MPCCEWAIHRRACRRASRLVEIKPNMLVPELNCTWQSHPPTDPHVSQSGVQTSHCSSPCGANTVLRTDLICRHLFVWFRLSVQQNGSFYITLNQDGRSETKMRRSKKNTPQCSIMYPIVYITVHIDVQVATHFELHTHTHHGWWHEEEQVLLLEGGRMNPLFNP